MLSNCRTALQGRLPNTDGPGDPYYDMGTVMTIDPQKALPSAPAARAENLAESATGGGEGPGVRAAGHEAFPSPPPSSFPQVRSFRRAGERGESRIGIDFDNTIVCYDAVFYRVALEQGLIPSHLPASKGAIRDYLREHGMENHWTAMQGYVYGERMIQAPAFPGVMEYVARLVRAKVPVFIVSHKTRYPYLGPKFDLHEGAHGWLETNGFFDAGRIGMTRDQVFFELTKRAKLQRIANLECTHFIDDLPELLAEPDFPKKARPWLFDPNNDHSHELPFARLSSWHNVPKELQAA